jgi:RimJ/RimL family protein N-acetyltransferase
MQTRSTTRANMSKNLPAEPAQENELVTSSERLSLYKFNPDIEEHSILVFNLFNSPIFIAAEGKTGIDSTDKAKAFIQGRYMSEYEKQGYGTYPLALKSTSPDQAAPIFIGVAGLTKGEDFSAPDINYALLPAYIGKGYATEAAKLVVEYAKTSLSLNDILGLCGWKNQASRKVLEGAGFESRGARVIEGHAGATAVYALPHMDQNMGVYGLPYRFPTMGGLN